MKKYIVGLLFLASALLTNAQQELMVSQYMFNGLLLNPAYAGTHEYFGASLLHRSQWVQFENAPVTQVFGIDGPIFNKKMGIGLKITNDQLGVEKQTELGLNLAKHFDLNTGIFSLGLSGNAAMYSAELTNLTVWDTDDQLYDQNIVNEVVIKFGFGAYYHTDSWYLGLSVPTLFSQDDKVIPSGSSLSKFFAKHYYLNAGIVLKPNYNLAIKPSILVKMEAEAPAELDLNCNFLLFKRFWIGAGYRTGDALVGMLEYNITPKFRAGYAYDFTTTDIKTYSAGSHEIMLGYDFGVAGVIKKRSPRYF